MSRGKQLDISDILKEIGEEEVLDPSEWVLLLLYASPTKSLPSIVHLQKAMFLASRYIDRLQKEVEFKAYRMGPWSEEINDSIEVLESSNSIEREGDNGPVKLNKEILRRVEDLWKELPSKEREILKHIASFVSNLSVDEVILYVYTVFGFKEKSDILDRLIKRRFSLAISMLKKGAISTELAAKIADMPVVDFVKKLKEMGIKPYSIEISDLECQRIR